MKNATSWKPGQSGNPGGKPAVIKEVQALARQHTTEAIDTLASIMRDTKLPAQARVAASNAILDRGYGRPPASDLEGAEGLIIKIVKFAELGSD